MRRPWVSPVQDERSMVWMFLNLMGNLMGRTAIVNSQWHRDCRGIG